MWQRISCIWTEESQSVKTVYNIALVRHAFSLANKLNLFARGLHTHVSLFICTFLSDIDVDNLKTLNSYFSSPKRWKNLMLLPEMRKIIPLSYKILSSSFLPGLQLGRFAKRGVESAGGTKALGTRRRTKTTTNWSVPTLRG